MATHNTKDIPRWFEPGTIIDDRFQVVELLGRGGVARVYRCIQLDIGREVALKVVSPDTNRAARRISERRLINEALTTARVHHPNVINIRGMGRTITTKLHDTEITYERPYLVMECLHGHSLADELALGGPMSPQRAIPLFLEVIDALAVAHNHEIVHKDLKPDNLFFTYPGHPREALIVLDFGIARAEEIFTVDGSVPCTVNYVEPEYIEKHIVTPAIDVYQIALVLIEALTGKPVVDSDYVTHCIAAHINGRLPVPDEIMNSPLGPILKAALQRDHTRRTPHCGALYESLSQLDTDTVILGEAFKEEDEIFFGDDEPDKDDKPTLPDARVMMNDTGPH